ncbi:MAG: ABC transporter ATP-binding protein [Candidatus Eremiobacterota bacterium]
MSLIEMKAASRVYQTGQHEVWALRPTDLAIERDEFVVILGPSGSGKTTMLNLLAGIDRPTGGSVTVDGTDLSGLNRSQLTDYRRRAVGVVFQFHNLIPNLTARENVELVAELARAGRPVEEVLESVGLSERADHFPHELSGGEQQRVAVARALVKDPPILVGDEPTGSLDAPTGRRVLSLFRRIHSQGKCVVLVTHNQPVAQIGTRILTMRDGTIKSDVRNPTPLDPETIDW